VFGGFLASTVQCLTCRTVHQRSLSALLHFLRRPPHIHPLRLCPQISRSTEDFLDLSLPIVSSSGQRNKKCASPPPNGVPPVASHSRSVSHSRPSSRMSIMLHRGLPLPLKINGGLTTLLSPRSAPKRKEAGEAGKPPLSPRKQKKMERMEQKRLKKQEKSVGRKGQGMPFHRTTCPARTSIVIRGGASLMPALQ
jgi:hypothetical protein